MAAIQKFGFRDSQYERPNQDWTCGHACEGQPCLLGPSPRGACQAKSTECRPVKPDGGDRYVCTRPEEMGGECKDGPLPDGTCCRKLETKCQPERTLRHWRGIIGRLTFALTFGLLLMFLTGDGGRHIASPGRLTFAHSSMEAHCADCHQAADHTTEGWLNVFQEKNAGHASSEQCLQCHNLGTNAASPHSLPADQLTPLTRSAGGRTGHTDNAGVALAGLFRTPGKGHATQLKCAACHVEHKGPEHDLTKLTNLQCQTCHTRQFHSFAEGHPEFERFPFHQNVSVKFDHLSHRDEHFTRANAKSAVCTDCHSVDNTSGAMITHSFEQMCGNCHSGGMNRGTGVPILSVPKWGYMTFYVKDKKGLGVGHWPAKANAPLTGIMQQLLGTNSAPHITALQNEIKKRQPDAEPDGWRKWAPYKKLKRTGIKKMSTNEVNAAWSLAWDVKVLLHDLHFGDRQATQSRLATALTNLISAPLNGQEMTLIKNVLPPAAAIEMLTTNAFPNLQAEIMAFRNDKNPDAISPIRMPKKAAAHSWPVPGGQWRLTNATLYFKPVGHANPFSSTWLVDLAKNASKATDEHGDFGDRLFNHMLGGRETGNESCLKCHLADSHVGGPSFASSTKHGAFAQDFTRFSHASHASLMNEQGCRQCHDLKAKKEPDTNYLTNFSGIEKATCAQCHKKNQAGNSCLLCHNYHVGAFEATLPRSEWRVHP
jgi:hypothetical protein